jgi:hypothetical protein
MLAADATGGSAACGLGGFEPGETERAADESFQDVAPGSTYRK